MENTTRMEVLVATRPGVEVGEIGEVIPNDFDKYDFQLKFEGDYETFFAGRIIKGPRVFYFYKNEVAPI